MIEYVAYNEENQTALKIETLYDELSEIHRQSLIENKYPDEEVMAEIYSRLKQLLLEISTQKAELSTILQVQMIFNKLKELEEDHPLENIQDYKAL